MADEELLDTGPRRRLPRSLSVAAIVLAAAVLVTALVVRSHDDVPSAAPSTPAPSTSTATSPGLPDDLPVVPQPSLPFDTGGTVEQQLLAYVYARTFDSEAGRTVVLTDTSASSCEQPPSDERPSDRLAALVTAGFPHATVRDVSRTIDKFAGLCVVEVRANVDDGTALVLRVVAPVEDAQLVQARYDHGSGMTNGLLVQFVRVTLRSGWTITVGTSGSAVSGPSQTALADLARDPHVLW